MRKRGGESAGTAAWIDQELAGCEFADVRLAKRFKTLVARLAEGVGESIPMACQDWAGTKAAYRFFANDRVSEAEILAGHFQATRDRFRATPGTVLVLHDTTELSFQREKKQAIGVTHLPYGGKGKDGRPRLHTVCGILLHSSLVVTLEGLPLGIAAVKAWTRKKFKGCNALKKKINPTRVPIEEKESVRWLENLRRSTALLNEPQRCIHIGDRESDIYELFCEAQNIGTHFLVRTCVDRLAGDGKHTIADEMGEVRVKGLHRIEVRDAKGDYSEAILEIRYRRIRVLPPIGKQQRYPATTLYVIHAQERGAPKGRERIEWKLITDLPVTSRAEAIEKLTWYAFALEDRDLSQDPEIGVQGGGLQAQNRRAPAAAARGILCPELADFLDDDDQPIRLKRTCAGRIYDPRAPTARSLGAGSRKRPRAKEISSIIPHQIGQTRRLSCPRY